jgi:Carboxypeptidase regulatory-like domain
LPSIISAAIMNILALLAGTLCVLSNGKLTNCTPTTGALIKLQPAAESRRVVWTSDDGKRLAVAWIAPNADVLDLGKLDEIALRISGDPQRGWPADLRIVDRNFTVTVPAKNVAKLTTLSLTPSRYLVAFQAEHHLTERRDFDLDAVRTHIDAGEIRLRPLPLVTGSVVAGKDVPVAGAEISSIDFQHVSTHLGTTDDKGAFRFELPERIVQAIVIARAGVGTKALPVDQLARGDHDFGVIRLVAGVPITINVVRPDAKPLTVTLLRRDRGVYGGTRVSSQTLAADRVTFDAVAPGEHYVLVEGSAPLERMSVPVKIEKPATVDIRIEPYTLAGRVALGGEPLAGAEVAIYPRDESWRVPLRAAADGTFGGTAWQHGVLRGAMKHMRLEPVGLIVDSPELPSAWNIDIGKRTITGRVYDAETKAPLSGDVRSDAAVWYGEKDRAGVYGGAYSDRDGNFTILAVWSGKYELSVTRPDYLPKHVTVEIADNDGSKQVEFALERGNVQLLVLRWPDGEPLFDAAVLDGDVLYRSDARGSALIRGVGGEVHTLYVLPKEGSIAVVHLPIGGKDAKPVEAIVGRPAGALRIMATFSDGTPFAGDVFLRFNGELIPPNIVKRYGFLEHLPAGMYEVGVMPWSGPPKEPGVRVRISSGEERVQITVPKR